MSLTSDVPESASDRMRTRKTAAVALHGSGWGEFNVVVNVKFIDGTEQQYNHWLKLSSSGVPEAPKKSSRKKRPAVPVQKPE